MMVEPYTGPAGDFPLSSKREQQVEAGAATRVLITADDGAVYFGVQLTEGGQVVRLALRTPSTAQADADAARLAVKADLAAKDATARNFILSEVATIKASGAPGSWSNANKRFMALVWALHRID